MCVVVVVVFKSMGIPRMYHDCLLENDAIKIFTVEYFDELSVLYCLKIENDFLCSLLLLRFFLMWMRNLTVYSDL